MITSRGTRLLVLAGLAAELDRHPITVESRDPGNASTATAQAAVPHDRGPH